MLSAGTYSGQVLLRSAGVPVDAQVVVLDGRPDDRGGERVDRLVETAARTIAPGGAIVLVAGNPASLRRSLSLEAGPAVAAPGRSLSATSLAGSLRELGFDEPRLLLPYPDRLAPRWVVDARLLDEPDGRSLVGSLVHEPVGARRPGEILAAHPRDAFLAALADGRAIEMADSYLVVARGGAVRSSSGDALMWLGPPASWRARWAVVRDLRRTEGGWQLGPVGPVDRVTDGPFVLLADMADVPVGECALDVLALALSTTGTIEGEPRNLLNQWLAAASEVIANAPSGHHPVDLSLRRFVITHEGHWRALPEDIGSTYRLPLETLAFGGLLRTLPALVSRIGLPDGLDGTLTVEESALRLLDSIGLSCGAAAAHLWHELEAQFAATVEGSVPDVGAGRDEARRRSLVPLWEGVLELPSDRLSEAIADGRLAATGQRVGARLETLDLELRRLERRVAAQAAKLDAARGALPLATHEERALRALLSERSDAQEIQRAELAWSEWQLRHEKAILPLCERGPDGRPPIERDIEAVRACDLFDGRWYLARYPDLAAAAMDPAFHWVRYGAAEGRDPGPAFRTKGYVLAHRDALEPGTNPLLHLLAQPSARRSTGRAAQGDGRSGGWESVATALDRLVGSIRTNDEYIAAIRQDEPWLEAARLVCQRLGIEPLDAPAHVPYAGRAPVILVPPEHAVKFYAEGWPERSAWANRTRGTLLDIELAMHRRLERDPALPVPRLVGHGALGQMVRYLVMTQIRGVPFQHVRHRLPDQRQQMARWLGTFVRRLHAVPVAPPDRASEWPRFAAYVARRLGALAGRLAERHLLPPHLLAELDSWLPTSTEMLGSSQRAVVVHGDLQWNHVLGHVDGEAFRPAGVIDLNRGTIGHPMYDVGRVWWSALGGRRELLEAFLEEANVPGIDEPAFPRWALAWGLLQYSEFPLETPLLEEVADLDELAERSFGDLRTGREAAHRLSGSDESGGLPSGAKATASGQAGQIAMAGEAIDRQVLELSSDDEYKAATRRDEPWFAAALAVCRHLGIETAGSPRRAPQKSRTPVILVPDGHVVKFYVEGWSRRSVESERAGRGTLLESELAMHQRLERDPLLPVPRLVAHGPLGNTTHYLVMTLIQGIPFESVRHRLPAQRAVVIAWLGTFVRRLYALAVEPDERADEWPSFSAWVRDRRRTAVGQLIEARVLPVHLMDEVAGWMPTAEELIGPPEQAVVVHGSLQWKHVVGRVEGDVFVPTGVVDLNSGGIGSPMFDLGRLWWSALRGDRQLLATFLEHSGIAAAGEPGFARRALAWGLLRATKVPLEIPWLDEVGSLDELAERCFGGLGSPQP